MNITVLGLGYVGCVSAASLAKLGHRVFGIDVQDAKVALINQGKSPIVEKGMDDLLAEVVAQGRLTAARSAREAVLASDVSLVCVGTPSRENGSLDLDHVRNVSREIGRALADHTGYHMVVVRSTMLPGSLEGVVLPLLEAESGRRAGADFGVSINPEFLREGSALADYHNPPFTLIGAADARSGDVVQSLYEGIAAPVIRTDVRTAEMVKYACNAFHALKVAFANELGLFCRAQGMDSYRVMEIFVRDTQLNISPRYLMPGFAFGGSCLPKDLRALLHRARSLDLDLPVLSAILPSNQRHIEHAFRMIQRAGGKRVGVLGLSFKAGTDDLRESPMVQLVERLIGKGYDVRIYDRSVSLARIVGSNRQYIEQVIPHISTLLVSEPEEVVRHAEVLVIGNGSPEFRDALGGVRPEQVVIDLVRASDGAIAARYEGICW